MKGIALQQKLAAFLCAHPRTLATLHRTCSWRFSPKCIESCLMMIPKIGCESKPRHPNGTLNSWLIDVDSPKYGNVIGFDPSPFRETNQDLGMIISEFWLNMLKSQPMDNLRISNMYPDQT